MACSLVCAKPLSEPMLEYYQMDPRNELQWNFYQNSFIFIQENPFENVVWKMAAILSRLQCVEILCLPITPFVWFPIVYQSTAYTRVASMKDMVITTYTGLKYIECSPNFKLESNRFMERNE